MFPFLKSTQTLIGSMISSIGQLIITRRKGEKQWATSLIFRLGLTFIFYILYSIFYIPPVLATTDPLAVPNNKFGIHIIQATPNESSPAAQLVNNQGDWGYITVLIKSDDRKIDKWQQFFNDLRRRHLIPLVRLTTTPDGNNWRRPTDSDAEDWANFLNSLNWPTKNRYVIVYNEPNHGTEWGGSTDPVSYAKVLDQTINALKAKNADFFVLNTGLDASTPQKPPAYMDEVLFLQQMNDTVPGIFDKLDGWVSHSYPNPGFVGSPAATGRGTVRTWEWELGVLNQMGVKKSLPIFISETGWKHAEGVSYDSSLPSADKVAEFYKTAFATAWNDPKIVAVTPFLLEYQDAPFDHFSFKKPEGREDNPISNWLKKVLSAQYPSSDEQTINGFYPSYLALKDLPKVIGRPVQENKFKLISGEIYRTMVAGQSYDVSLELQNTGQSIWNDSLPVKLIFTQGGKALNIPDLGIPADQKIEPGQKYTFRFKVQSPQNGLIKTVANLYAGSNAFDSNPLQFTTEVKSPVVLKVKGGLKWKDNPSGNYMLSIVGSVGSNSQVIGLNSDGVSPELQAMYLLPDYDFDFTLQKPFYKSTTVHKLVKQGVNVLDFGNLEPDLFSAILNPKELWKLLPFSK